MTDKFGNLRKNTFSMRLVISATFLWAAHVAMAAQVILVSAALAVG